MALCNFNSNLGGFPFQRVSKSHEFASFSLLEIPICASLSTLKANRFGFCIRAKRIDGGYGAAVKRKEEIKKVAKKKKEQHLWKKNDTAGFSENQAEKLNGGCVATVKRKEVKKVGKKKEQHLWKKNDSAGSGQKALNLVRMLSGLPNEKEAVYGALNKWVAWEIEFPIIAAAKALQILRKRSQWHRVIQVAKWMLSKGQGATMGTYDTLLLAFDMDQRPGEADSLWNMILHTHTRSIPRRLFARMIALYAHHDLHDKVIAVFADMEELKVKPDEDSTRRVARAFRELGQEENRKLILRSGNNNQLTSLARSNYFPYGIDFPYGPTGRFSNGKTTVDVITELLGFDDYITPYAQARGEEILRGVNYASAAAGIREETGRQLGGRITFAGQVANHLNTVSEMVNILGDENEAANYLSKCIYSIGLGSNDYLNNYFMPLYYSTGSQYSPDSYANDLINRYTEQLRILYNNGARKFALVGIGAIGCSPNELAQNSRDGVTCDERINSANRVFNSKLVSIVDYFNRNTDAKFTYINAYGIFQDMVANPSRYGFRVTNAGCCGVGRNNGQITCLPGQPPCLNRDEFVFWDAFHPGEAANIVIGSRSFRRASGSDAHPYDIEQLARL